MKNISLRRMLSFLLTGWLVVGIDQISKYFAVTYLKPGQPVEILGELLRFVLVYNDSAAFSIGFGVTWVFTIFSTLAALTILWFAPKFETMGWVITGGLALGGVVGNLIDRLTREPGFAIGRVVDFISIPLNFPIFNVSDLVIVIVAIITILRVIAGTKVGKAPAVSK